MVSRKSKADRLVARSKIDDPPRSSRVVRRSDHEKEFEREGIPKNHENTCMYIQRYSHKHGSKRARKKYGEEQGRKTADKGGNGHLIHVKVRMARLWGQNLTLKPSSVTLI